MYEVLLVLFSLIVFLQIFYPFPILSLQAPARAEYERKEKILWKKKSIDERIDRLAIAYITSHYDVSQMSVEEYFEKFKEVSNKIFDLYSFGN